MHFSSQICFLENKIRNCCLTCHISTNLSVQGHLKSLSLDDAVYKKYSSFVLIIHV